MVFAGEGLKVLVLDMAEQQPTWNCHGTKGQILLPPPSPWSVELGKQERAQRMKM